MADIVVGVDGSTGSVAALEWALAEASRRRLRVRAVLGASSGEQPPAVRRSADAAVGAHDEAAVARAAEQVLSETIASVRNLGGVEIAAQFVSEPGAEALLTVGRDAEMIVVGARGRGLLHRLRIGSVSASVAVHSPVPVIVARVPPDQDADERGAHAPDPGRAAPRPVVVGVDGSPNSLAALRWAAQAAALRATRLDVVHAWLAAVPLPFAETSGEIVQALEEQARVVLDESVDQVLGPTAPEPGPGAATDSGPESAGTARTPRRPGAGTITVRRELVPASATRALLDASHGADLLVVGARGRGGFAELLLGSVSHQTMLHAAAPVAIIRDV